MYIPLTNYAGAHPKKQMDAEFYNIAGNFQECSKE